jgi:preprotein translocase subunit SecG
MSKRSVSELSVCVIIIIIIIVVVVVVLLRARQPPVGQGLLIHEGLDRTQRRTTVGRNPLDE